MSESRRFSSKSFSPRQCVQRSISTEKDKEKDEMIGLNDYFVELIEKVIEREDEKLKLETELKILKEYEVSKGKVDDIVDLEKMKLEHMVENLVREKEMLQAELDKNEQDNDFTRTRIEEEEIKKNVVENDCILTKQALDKTLLVSRELMLDREVLEANFNFLKAAFDEEIKELESQIHKEKVTLLSKNQRSLDMNDIINNVKLQYTYMEHQFRDNAERWHKAKLDAMANKAKQQKEGVDEVKRNIAELLRQIHWLNDKLESLESQEVSLKKKISDDQEDTEVDNADKGIALKMETLRQARLELAGLIREYQELMNTKLGLGVEIATYRKLLEGEEQRLGNTHQSIHSLEKPQVPHTTKVPVPASQDGHSVKTNHLLIQMQRESGKVVKSFTISD